MNQTQREFFTCAIERSGAINAASFARKLDVSEASISKWKSGKKHPSDKTMLKVALICELDPVEALALLNLWRCDEAAKSTYERLLEVAQSTALKCFPYMFALALASQGNTFKSLEHNENSKNKFLIISQFDDYAIFNETLARNTRRKLTTFINAILRRAKYRLQKCALGGEHA